MRIEFDPDKENTNWKKHRISFSTAALVFTDPMRVERLDDSIHNPGEERWQTLGMVGRVLFVVYTERGENIRLISARLATKEERRSYYAHDHNNDRGWTKAY
jgi:uncharacterized DUF497 family protein